MGIVQLASGIFAVAKAVPKVMELIERISNMFVDHQLAELEDQDNTYIHERRAISNALEVVRDRNELKALSRRLAELDRLHFLPDYRK